MNTQKSKLVNLLPGEPGFDFLGFHHRRMPVVFEGGRVRNYLRSFPSKKAMKKMRAKVKEEMAPRNRLYRTPEQVVADLNPMIQGWRNYYGSVDSGVSRRFLMKVDWYIFRRLVLFWRKKHKRNRLTPTQIMRVFESKGLKTISGYGQL